jgi:hypothetical protein
MGYNPWMDIGKNDDLWLDLNPFWTVSTAFVAGVIRKIMRNALSSILRHLLRWDHIFAEFLGKERQELAMFGWFFYSDSSVRSMNFLIFRPGIGISWRQLDFQLRLL